MYASTLIVAVAAFVGLASAQNYSTSGPLMVNVSQIDPDLKQQWCHAQENSCPEICGGTASQNTCDAPSLNYTCTCPGSTQPNISNYDQTIPSFVCYEWISNCVDNHPNDLTGITACRSVTCGSANASEAESNSSSSATTSASSASATAMSTSAMSTAATSTSASASAASATSTKNAAVALNLAQTYGTTVIGTAMLAIFGLAL